MSHSLVNNGFVTTFTTEDREMVEKELLRHQDKSKSKAAGMESQSMPTPNSHQNMGESLRINTAQPPKDSN